ncbi:choline/ethanolaminephosphotransferase 1-like isoform X1 [Gossypium australe]|uniref:Choline/ethanolaminephosphotransferase 1-like isoform X1 n=1 Tax=Gossypium australe TaxID=47621 RepID=A0A5B6X1Y4_9ROSI|nr:choline/ethanolaminephosphotransferase 1-like isoform X1 [Gossypium australe]
MMLIWGNIILNCDYKITIRCRVEVRNRSTGIVVPYVSKFIVMYTLMIDLYINLVPVPNH